MELSFRKSDIFDLFWDSWAMRLPFDEYEILPIVPCTATSPEQSLRISLMDFFVCSWFGENPYIKRRPKIANKNDIFLRIARFMLNFGEKMFK